MTQLREHHASLGAELAADGIPLHYGDLAAEYAAALNGAVLLDRSHEGRLRLEGKDRFEFVNRMSTNDTLGMAAGECRPTIFVNANVRILFRVLCINRADQLLLLAGPGQGAALLNMLRRNLFFGDAAHVHDLGAGTAQFGLHGPAADEIIAQIDSGLAREPRTQSAEVELDGISLTLARRKAIVGAHWIVLAPYSVAGAAHRHLLRLGAELGLLPAGSLTFNTLRIRSGQPAGLELSSDYIPLEVGLWDEISFAKGCYTGQEIIARMESRGRLAKTLVKLELDAFVAAPAPIYAGKGSVGRLTSSAMAPAGDIFALAVVKTNSAMPGTELQVGDAAIGATVTDYAGVQPAFVTGERA